MTSRALSRSGLTAPFVLTLHMGGASCAASLPSGPIGDDEAIGSPLNPVVGSGEVIHLNSESEPGEAYPWRGLAGESCFVYGSRLEGQEDPIAGSGPPQVEVTCPEEMEAFASCRLGLVYRSGRGGCICMADGNPPPPARRITCPE